MMLYSLTTQATENVRLHGALVAEPCRILSGEENLRLEFGTVIDKYLYLNQRTRGQLLELYLADCDLSLGNTVRITFNGTENLHLPGLLAIDANSQATGIAIGLETLEGKALPINQSGPKYSLVTESNVITLKAYVQGEPEALENNTIGLGTFSAVATFNLEYE
nr:fimbrial protein [Serratia fonticola]